MMNYQEQYKNNWPPRVFIWAWHTMPRILHKGYTGADVIDYYKKLANKKAYFLLLSRLGLKKTNYELGL